ncbi:MAG: hypothetical protein KA885_03365 [Spirochaetes bacterium]|nr:hypothetical protein [Spirochaetota bacterium]
MAFSIKKETRVSKYSLPLALRNRNGKIIKFVSGAALMASLNSCWFFFGNIWATAGLPAAEYVDRNGAIKIVEDELNWYTATTIVFQRDVKLAIQDQTGDVIDFIADGYNAERKIIYELTAYYDFKYAENSKEKIYLDPTTDILTTNEKNLIKNFTFGDHYFCVIESDYDESIYSEVDNFAYFYYLETQKDVTTDQTDDTTNDATDDATGDL